MITINAGFSRRVARPHKRTIIETKNVTGIKLNFDSWEDAHRTPEKQKRLYAAIRKHAPGPEWSLSGFAPVEET